MGGNPKYIANVKRPEKRANDAVKEKISKIPLPPARDKQ